MWELLSLSLYFYSAAICLWMPGWADDPYIPNMIYRGWIGASIYSCRHLLLAGTPSNAPDNLRQHIGTKVLKGQLSIHHDFSCVVFDAHYMIQLSLSYMHMWYDYVWQCAFAIITTLFVFIIHALYNASFHVFTPCYKIGKIVLGWKKRILFAFHGDFCGTMCQFQMASRFWVTPDFTKHEADTVGYEHWGLPLYNPFHIIHIQGINQNVARLGRVEFQVGNNNIADKEPSIDCCKLGACQSYALFKRAFPKAGWHLFVFQIMHFPKENHLMILCSFFFVIVILVPMTFICYYQNSRNFAVNGVPWWLNSWQGSCMILLSCNHWLGIQVKLWDARLLFGDFSIRHIMHN